MFILILILLLLFSSCPFYHSSFSSSRLIFSLEPFSRFNSSPSSLSSSKYYLLLRKLTLLHTVILIHYHHSIFVKVAMAAAVALSVMRPDTVKEDERNNRILQSDVQWNGMQMHILFFHVMSCHVMSCHVISPFYFIQNAFQYLIRGQ